MATTFNDIVALHGRAVYLTAWRIVGHEADAEDVVQEVFFEAFRLRGGKHIENWQAFLKRLATCRALDSLRKKKSQISIDGLAIATPADEPWAAASALELAERLRQALGELSEREASVFCLGYFEGLSNLQIAEALEIRAGAVAVALHKARAKLAELLAEAPKGD
jgi:RNA polymerase sigma-70 factor (ECF subfamily)